MLSNVLLTDPAGCGVVWIVQTVPFHSAANGVLEPEASPDNPTAVQALDEVQDTSER